jgi:hypothetical protein
MTRYARLRAARARQAEREHTRRRAATLAGRRYQTAHATPAILPALAIVTAAAALLLGFAIGL